MDECNWTRAFDGHFNLSCVNKNHNRGNRNFKPDLEIKDTKWDFTYCPYCSSEIHINKQLATGARDE